MTLRGAVRGAARRAVRGGVLGMGGRVLPPAGFAFVTFNGQPVTFNGQNVIARIA